MNYEALCSAGCNIENALDRFVNDIDFYTQCIDEMKDEPAFQKLGESLNLHNKSKSLDYALVLKSIICSLEIQPLQNIISQLVENIHDNNYDSSLFYYNQLITQKDLFFDKIKDCE